jgi:hypothetical protein
MVPCAQAPLVRAELGRLQEEEETKGMGVRAKEGAAPAPANLYPVLFVCDPAMSGLSIEEAEARVDRAVQRLETALRIAGAGDASAFLPECATMVVSPWGKLDPPLPASGAGGDGPVHYTSLSQQPPQQPADSVLRRTVPGRGTTHLLPTPPPQLLLDSLRLLRDCFLLDLAPGRERLQEGHDFFQAWALATLGCHEQGGVVRARVAATIAGRGEWVEEAQESVRAALGGGTANDYLLMVTNDMNLSGGSLEVQAAAAYDNARIAVFDVDAQRLSTLAPPSDSPLPVTREAALLHYQGAYWLLEPVGGSGGEMDMTMTGAMSAMQQMTMAAGDLDASMNSASQGMSDV